MQRNKRMYRRLKWWEKFILVFSPLLLIGCIGLSSYLPFFKATYMKSGLDFSLKRELGTLFFAGYAAASSAVSALESPEPKGTDSIPEIRIFIPRNSLKELVSNVPDSTKKYYNAVLKYPDGKGRAVKYRLRGSNEWHWQIDKPSIRIKTQKNDLYEGRRYIELTNPEDKLMMRNLMEDYFTHKFGVMASNTSFAKLFINNKYFGLYHFTLRPDDIFLMEHKRVPGIIYKERGEIKDKLAMWRDPVVWDLMAVKDENDKNYEPMNKLLEAINSGVSVDSIGKLWGILNKDKMARWLAAMNLFQGIHSDSIHNQLFYFDPTMGLIEPIADDINGHGMLTPYSPFRFKTTLELGLVPEYRISLNERLTPILDLALRDPVFIHMRNRHLWDAINGFGSYKEQARYIDEQVSRIDSAVRADVHRGYIRFTPAGIHRLPYPYLLFRHEIWGTKKWIKKREDFIKTELEKCKVEIFVEPSLSCLIRVTGNSAAKLDDVLFYPGIKVVDSNPDFKHFFGLRYPEYALEGGSCDYRMKFPGVEREKLLAFLAGNWTNSITGSPIEPDIKMVEEGGVSVGANNYSPLHSDSAKPETITLGPGEVELEEDLYVDEKGTLNIASATTLLMHPGVSMFCKGKALLEGDKERPIKFVRADAERPWGAFVLQGENTAGSVMKYVSFSGGSVDTAFNIDYSGMVSVHWCPSITIENCDFSGNTLGDDCLHIVHSRVSIKDSGFHGANADGIDFDIVDGEISNCVFEKSGNDLLDLMTSNVAVSNCLFSGAGDKGISIGEKSNPVISDCEFVNCNKGVETKDGSFAVISDSTFKGNNTAYHAYRKKWAYEHAGSGRLITSKITSDNKTGIILENDGRLEMFETECSSDIIGKEGIVYLDDDAIRIQKPL